MVGRRIACVKLWKMPWNLRGFCQSIGSLDIGFIGDAPGLDIGIVLKVRPGVGYAVIRLSWWLPLWIVDFTPESGGTASPPFQVRVGIDLNMISAG